MSTAPPPPNQDTEPSVLKVDPVVEQALVGDDVTVFVTTVDASQLEPEGHPLRLLFGAPESPEGRPKRKKRCSGSWKMSLRLSEKLRNGENLQAEARALYPGRALVCSCYHRRYASITFRLEACKIPLGTTDPPPKSLTSKFWDEKSPDEDYPVPISAVVKYLAGLLGAVPRKGMLFITGATGSGKTQVANGLVHTLVDEILREVRSNPKRRRPHVVTAEDYIETLMFKDPEQARSQWVDYTPRQIGLDTPSVEKALEDALRQKPTVVSLGEVRKPEDLRAMSAFARTGHLVVATAHAGSLVEAMDKLFEVNDADSPSRRGQVAESLFACIHLRVHRFPGGWAVCYPTVWRRTTTGVAEIVSDGLAALLPNCSSPSTTPPGCSSFGRLHFVGTVLDPEAGNGHNPLGWALRQSIHAELSLERVPDTTAPTLNDPPSTEPVPALPDQNRPYHFRAKAAEWDIEGL